MVFAWPRLPLFSPPFFVADILLPRKADSKRWLWLFASADHKLLHRAGEHHNPDCLRMATIHPFIKTTESLPDALVLDGGGDPWRDWGEAIKTLPDEGARL